MKVQFTSPKSRFALFAKLIQIFERVPYTHVRVITNEFILEANKKGVQIYPNYSHIANAVNVHHEFTFSPKLTDTQFLNVLFYYINTPYSFLQILAIAWKYITGKKFKKINLKKRVICSELVGYILADCYDIPIPYDMDYLTPRQLYEELALIKRCKLCS